MEIKVTSKYIRISPRKARLVLDVIRGMKVKEAEQQLQFINKKATDPISKLLNSAIANAEHNYGLNKENLYIKIVTADGGPTVKRWTSKAFGRATPIRKRSAHFTMILDELVKTQSEKAKGVKKDKLEEPKILESMPSAEKSEKKIEKEGKTASKELSREKKADIFDSRMVGKHRQEQHKDKIKSKGKGGAIRQFFRRKTD